MKNIRLKLNSNEGKTILMALFLLLVAVVVSVVIITAATTAAHQLNDNKEAQQTYLTVSSAAELFRDEIRNKEYKHTLRTYTAEIDNIEQKPPEETVSEPDGAFKDLLTEIAENIKNSSPLNSNTKEATVKINKPAGAENSVSFDDVTVRININPVKVDDNTVSENSYTMNISFEAAGKKSDEQGYKMNLSLPVTKTISTSSGFIDDNKYSVTTTETTVTFGNGTIIRAGIN